jgi:hypothetical protein
MSSTSCQGKGVHCCCKRTRNSCDLCPFPNQTDAISRSRSKSGDEVAIIKETNANTDTGTAQQKCKAVWDAYFAILYPDIEQKHGTEDMELLLDQLVIAAAMSNMKEKRHKLKE